MIAQVTNLEADELIMTFGDAHIYNNHFTQVKEQLSRKAYALPKLWLNPEIKDIFKFEVNDIKLENYHHHPSIKANMAV
jgi:thymidylate synthase